MAKYLDQSVHDAKAKSVSLASCVRHPSCLVKLLENVGHVLGANPPARIRHVDAQLASFTHTLHSHRTFVRKLERIAEKISQDLAEQLWIGARSFMTAQYFKAQTLCCCDFGKFNAKSLEQFA